MKLTKQKALDKIEELKGYIKGLEGEKENKTVIYHQDGSVLYSSDKNNLKEALVEAVDREVDLRGANLREANLGGAELNNAKFYGKGGTSKLKKSQVKDFLAALGFVIEED